MTVEFALAHQKSMSDFQYSLNSSTIRPTPILRKIAIAAEVGFTGIEIWRLMGTALGVRTVSIMIRHPTGQ